MSHAKMIALGFPAYVSCRSERTGAWERQPIQFSFPVPGPIPSVRKARMPIWLCQAPMAALYCRLTWGTDRLMAFRLDRERGTLSPVDPPWTELPPGTGPRHLAFHPRQPFAYFIIELQSTVAETGRKIKSLKSEDRVVAMVRRPDS